MINADPQELAKFSELAHRWWDPDSEFRPLHQINPLRLEWIAKRCADCTGKSVLDVGCGGGILSEAMARRGADVLGIDLADKPLKVAQLHALEAGTPRVDYRVVSAEDLAAEQPGQFDVLTCMEMLEHVPDPASVVRACAALVEPGGSLFFSTSTAIQDRSCSRSSAPSMCSDCCPRARMNMRSSFVRASWRNTAATPEFRVVETSRPGIQPADARAIGLRAIPASTTCLHVGSRHD